jgi:cyclase
VGLAAWIAVAASLAAQTPPPALPAPPPITIKELRLGVYAAITGGGSNSTVIVGRTGVIVVDARQNAAAAQDLLTEIGKITAKPVTTVILTHSDSDHVNGLVAFPENVTVIAHENNRKELEAALAAGGRGAPPPGRLPSRTMTREAEPITVDGVSIELYHWAPAHTTGDLVVFLPESRVMITGDVIETIRADDDPYIHPDKNGSTDGWIATVTGLLGLSADVYIPGHGDLASRADVQRKLAATTARREKIATMMKQGKSLEDIKAADVLPAGMTPGRGGIPRAAYDDIAYAELTRK